jgi:hypothetical protein
MTTAVYMPFQIEYSSYKSFKENADAIFPNFIEYLSMLVDGH